MKSSKYCSLLLCAFMLALACKKKRNASTSIDNTLQSSTQPNNPLDPETDTPKDPSACNAGEDYRGFYIFKNGQKTYPEYKHTPKTKEELIKLLNAKTPLKDINTYYIKDMSKLFENRNDYNFDGIENWIVCQVTNMSTLFSGCKTFNKDLSKWNVSQVKNMEGMFFKCETFNQELSKWNVSQVTNMKYFFYYCPAFNQNLSKWNVSQVTNMGFMFSACTKFNQDLSNWDVSQVSDMQAMFLNCSAFNQDLSKWNINNSTDITNMFLNTPMVNKTEKHPKKKSIP